MAKASDDDVRMAVDLVEIYGLTSREVAPKFGVKPRTVRNWVAGARRNVARIRAQQR